MKYLKNIKMTSKEVVAFLKGLAIGINDTPNEEQWIVILKKLGEVREDEGGAFIQEIKEEIDKFIKPIIKKYPGAPPDIFM